MCYVDVARRAELVNTRNRFGRCCCCYVVAAAAGGVVAVVVDDEDAVVRVWYSLRVAGSFVVSNYGADFGGWGWLLGPVGKESINTFFWIHLFIESCTKRV